MAMTILDFLLCVVRGSLFPVICLGLRIFAQGVRDVSLHLAVLCSVLKDTGLSVALSVGGRGAEDGGRMTGERGTGAERNGGRGDVRTCGLHVAQNVPRKNAKKSGRGNSKPTPPSKKKSVSVRAGRARGGGEPEDYTHLIKFFCIFAYELPHPNREQITDRLLLRVVLVYAGRGI